MVASTSSSFIELSPISHSRRLTEDQFMAIAKPKNIGESIRVQLSHLSELNDLAKFTIKNTIQRYSKKAWFSHFVGGAYYPILLPVQAVKVMRVALDLFGNEGAIAALDLLKDSLYQADGWYNEVRLPKTQIAVLQSVVSSDKVDLRTALHVLKELQFYKSYDRDEIYEVLENWCLVPIPKDPLFLTPFKIFGEKYQEEGFRAVLAEAKNDKRIDRDDIKSQILDYYVQKFGNERKKEIEAEFPPESPSAFDVHHPSKRRIYENSGPGFYSISPYYGLLPK